MRIMTAAALSVGLMAAAIPARAQNLNDMGRLLQNQLQPKQNNDDRDRAYQQGRRDQEEQARRERDIRRPDDRGRQQFDNRDRQRQDDTRRFRNDNDRDGNRTYPDDQSSRSGRY